MADEKAKHAGHLTIGGIAAQFTTGIGNIVANSAGLYNALPYVGSGAGAVVIGGGIAARVVTAIKSHHLREQALCEYAETEAEKSVRSIAQKVNIISFVPTFGGSEVTRKMLRDIRSELDTIDPSVEQELPKDFLG